MIYRRFLPFIFLFCGSFCLPAQYVFSLEKLISSTEVENSANENISWVYAGSSFLEAEIIRMGHDPINLSELFFIRNMYLEKSQNYVLRKGYTAFSESSFGIDLIRSITKYGILPQVERDLSNLSQSIETPTELHNGLKGYLQGIVMQKEINDNWKKAVNSILDIYLNPAPDTFKFKGESYTASSFLDSLNFENEEYLSLSSFTHHPFFAEFVIEVPDNYSNVKVFNIPLDELTSITDFALLEGYSLIWEGDTSESFYNIDKGLAVIPQNEHATSVFYGPKPEQNVTQLMRQTHFERYKTTHDHSMHLVGIAFDQYGNKYYVFKDPRAKNNVYGGFLYMSESYFKLKTITVSLNKNALPKNAVEKLLSSAEMQGQK